VLAACGADQQRLRNERFLAEATSRIQPELIFSFIAILQRLSRKSRKENYATSLTYLPYTEATFDQQNALNA
jgi:hypothetical protein